MFVIELTYQADLSKIDEVMGEHVSFLKKHYASGIFVASGRQVPRDGGIVIATGVSREKLEDIMRQDPFYSRGLAEFRIIEFRVSQRARNLKELFDAEPSR